MFNVIHESTKSKVLYALLFLGLVLALIGCAAATPAPTEALILTEAPTPVPAEVVTEAPEPRELVVFGASSLTDAFTEAGTSFETANPGVTVTFSFASSSDLATQLAEGAPADIFASANARQMQVAADGGRIVGQPVNFLTNRLTVIVPAGNPAGIQSLADLKKEGLRLVLAAPDVPIRGFAEQVLDKVAADPAFGATFKEDVLAQLVSEEANVRQVVAKVSLGEADAGIVYVSDVTPDVADSIEAITIPDELNVLAVYPIAATSDSTQAELAQAFIDFILSEDGQAILSKWGFGPKPE